MKIRITATATLTFFVLVLASCAQVPEEHRGAATGAGVGAATGALAGAALGDTRGAILGGLAGALIGGAVGHYKFDKEKDAEATAQQYNYQPSSGTVLRVEDVSASPSSIQAGNQVDLQSRYAVMTPLAEPVQITEEYTIRHNGQLVGNPKITVSHEAGTYSSSIPLNLPNNAPRGEYRVVATISTPTSSDARETTFTVR